MPQIILSLLYFSRLSPYSVTVDLAPYGVFKFFFLLKVKNKKVIFSPFSIFFDLILLSFLLILL